MYKRQYLSSTLTEATRAKLNEILADSLVSNPNSLPRGFSDDPQREEILVYLQNHRGDAAQYLQRQFANDVVNKSKQYGAGISAENIPISLAQLDQEYAPFQCSGAAGSTALDKSFGFLVVDTSTDLSRLDGGLDVGSYVRDLTAVGLADWNTRQEALRGNLFPNSFDDASLNDFVEIYDQFAQINTTLDDAADRVFRAAETPDENED